ITFELAWLAPPVWPSETAPQCGRRPGAPNSRAQWQARREGGWLALRRTPRRSPPASTLTEPAHRSTVWRSSTTFLEKEGPHHIATTQPATTRGNLSTRG